MFVLPLVVLPGSLLFLGRFNSFLDAVQLFRKCAVQHFHQIIEIKVVTASRLHGRQSCISLGRYHPKVCPNESKHSHKEQYGEPSGYDEIGESFFPL
jgi:hypothetical protein